MWVASEVSAFSRHCSQFVALQDGEVAVLSANHHSLALSRAEEVPQLDIQLKPDPYPHWTIKEILEQPNAIGTSAVSLQLQIRCAKT